MLSIPLATPGLDLVIHRRRPALGLMGAAAFSCLLSFGLAGRMSAQTASYEAENLTYTATGATASVQTDTNSSGGKWVELAGNSTGDYIDFAIPSMTAGTYQLQMEWKGNNSRGILQLSVDGTNLGSTLDQYSATQSYPTTPFGNITFTSTGTHTIRLTVTGKNASSSSYQLSADKFAFTLQTSQVAAPVFNPGAGTYTSAQTVAITSSTSGASIRYTTDGSTPSETAGTVYSSPVSISATTTLKAIAYETGFTDSSVTNAAYTINTQPLQAAAPSFSPAGGTYTSAQTVTITSSTGGVLIRYTTDGSTPSETNGTVYSTPVSVSATTTLQAIAYESGYIDSTVTSATYTISTGGGGTTQTYEAESLSYTGTGATTSVQTDVNSSGGKWVQLASNAAGQYIDFTLPNVPAGTYQVQLEYKGLTSRGIVQLSIDGANLGGTVDEYSSAQTYPTATIGSITFATTASHDLRLTVTGKNSASTNYYISADKFTLQAGQGGGSGSPNGNPILPPKWAFGVMFGCYDNRTGVLSDMSQLRNGYCGDLIWVDSSWLGSNYNGPGSEYIDFKFDPSQFGNTTDPDPNNPQSMIATLHSNNFHFGVWEWPWIDKSNSLYSTGANNHYFIENSSGTVVNGGGWHGVTYTGQFDLSTTAAANWWKSLNAPLFTMGFDFLKMDTTVAIPTGGVLANGSTKNADWLGFYRKAAYEDTTTANLSQGRGLILAHTDVTGGAATNNDQYPGLWTGDTTATFSNPGSQGGFSDKDMAQAYKCNTKTTAAYWCGDTGGYNNNSNDELYQRWLQYSAFTPLQEFFGAKGTTGSNGQVGRFPWCFSATAQATFAHYEQMRYQLLPFRYSNAQACYHVTGGSVLYPVWWPNAQQIINGQGTSEILVQPVTVAGATSVSVTFPESSSTTWLDYTDYLNGTNLGKTHAGGSTATITAPVTEVPLFIKAGSIIPMIVNYDSNGNAIHQDYIDQSGFQAGQLTVDIYPSGSTSYSFYEDDGISDLYYTDNEFSTTSFTSDNTSGKEVVTIGAANGSFVGQFASRTYYLKIELQSAAPAGATLNGTAIGSVSSKSALVSASSGWYYDSAAKVVWVKFSASTSAPASIALQ
ncbi:MAG TPA: TIM-barrel domain-containing protein [Opitutaceae bacterium]|nr:TIM-barrel domain-containing protein [Opitutaceae bacterium]